MVRNIKKNKLIAHIQLSYLYSVGILQIFTPIFNSQFIVYFFLFIIFLLYLFVTRFKINKKIYIFLIFLILFIILDFILRGSSFEFYLNFLSTFLIISMPAILIFSNEFNKYFFKYLNKYNYFAFIMIVLNILINSREDYLRLGYALSLVVIVLLSDLFNKKKLIDLVFFSLGFLIMIFIGARGTFLVLFISIILLFISRTYVLKKSRLIRLMIVSLFLLPLIFLDVASLLNTFFQNSRITYYINILFSGNYDIFFGARQEIYLQSIEYFIQSPIFGNGLEFFVLNSSTQRITYIHNIFFQILVEFGIVGFIFLILFLLRFLKTVKNLIKKDYQKHTFVLLLFSLSIGRLLVSSDFWIRPDFWIIVSIVLFWENRNEKYV